MDVPKTMEEAWQAFAAKAIPPTMTVDQRIYMKTIFFSGMTSMFGICFKHIISFTTDGIEMDMTVANHVQAEVEAWQILMNSGAPNALRLN